MQQTQQQAQVPFPILPTAIQIGSILAGLFPLVDIEDDRFVFRKDDVYFKRSLQALALGCCFLFLGYFACQFTRSISPLRREYLGALALCTGLHAALAAARAILNPTAVATAAASTAALGALAGGGVALLLAYDKAAAPNPWMAASATNNTDERTRAARRIVAGTTHALWLLAAVTYHLPYLPAAVQSLFSPVLGPGSVAQLDRVYVLGGAVVTDLVALARLLRFVASRKVKGE